VHTRIPNPCDNRLDPQGISSTATCGCNSRPHQLPDTRTPTTNVCPVGLIPPSPLIKEEQAATPADASTTNKKSAKPPATPRTYHCLHKPTAKLNTHIHDETFLTTITTQYSGASTDITLTCTYDNNPQATLTAALSILGTTLLTEVLQKMFQYNPTKS
jgi:hypothetical protein